MLRERQKSILDAVIREYVRTARPVASREIVRHFEPKVSPATIRNEMLELDDFGYLEQPYTSAGRIPTDKGYRFFVDYLTAEAALNENESHLFDEVFDVRDESEFTKKLGKLVSHLSGTFTAVGAWDEGFLYETGLAEVLDEPEFRDPIYNSTFGEIVDQLEENVRSLWEECNMRGARVLIGKENPWEQARGYSMTVSSWMHRGGFRGFLTMVGPKRTDYRAQKAIVRKLNQRHE